MNNDLRKNLRSENGVALVTTLMITVLLGIACIAMLSSVGANSMNSTDVLSETKAYYAAESGLQATINVLRYSNPDVTYDQAVANPDLSNWLTYNCEPTTTNKRITVGSAACLTPAETSYKVSVSDPDDSKNSLTFSTVGDFREVTGTTSSKTIDNPTDPNSKIIISFTNVTNCKVSFTSNINCLNNTNPNSPFTTIELKKFNSGATLPTKSAGGLPFTIEYYLYNGSRQGKKTVRGKFSQENATAPIEIRFDTNTYSLMGTIIKLCETATTASPCPAFTPSVTLSAGVIASVPIYMTTTPVEPYRLKVVSIGYGPNRAEKRLEAIIQKNPLNDLAASSAMTMQGTSTNMVFKPGSSAVFAITGQDSGGIVVPSVGVIDQAGLTTVTNNIPNNNNNITPAPAILTDIPQWMATPVDLNNFVNLMRNQAKSNSSPTNPRYFDNPTKNITNAGDYATGTGITFCEGDCTIGKDGGGILIVTGTLENIGGWNFKGLIVVTGPGGWERSGGGGGTISGSVVIAPYTSADLVANQFTLSPKYTVTGSGTSIVEFDGKLSLDSAFNGTSSITDLMLGIAEK